jgi:hypothetical protein
MKAERKYLYAWRNPAEGLLVLSGVTFAEFVQDLQNQSGLLLIRHQSSSTRFDPKSRFEVVLAEDFSDLTNEDIYSWGDFVFVDFRTSFPLSIRKEAVAQLLYFGQMGRPYSKVRFLDLDNTFMYWGHDDGWYLALYGAEPALLDGLVSRKMQKLGLKGQSLKEAMGIIEEGKQAIWVADGTVEVCQQSRDIDAIIADKGSPTQPRTLRRVPRRK